MTRATVLSCVIAGGLGAAAFAGDPWVTFGDETATRLAADADVGELDVAEKDYAWGDIDNDGDFDLVVARKEPFVSSGRRANVLLMNEDGVLVDRTVEFATQSDALQDFGFLTPTNDRDVTLVDVNLDGWLDVVTCTTLSDGEPKHISHPRVYINGGEIDGEWQGLRFEDARFPQLMTSDGVPGSPRFNAMAAGDVTGNGFPDLFFVDSDQGGPGVDLNDRLLINDGNGFFIDVSEDAMTPEMLESVAGTGVVIADVNNDGFNDVVKSMHLSPPVGIFVAYNSASGFFAYESIYNNSPKEISVGDLNQDGRLDVVVTDDNTDRYLLNQGTDADGFAQFTTFAFPSSSQGFGGGSLVADLDKDNFHDVLIADMDNELPGCDRTLNFYRNEGDVPNVSFADDPPAGMEPADREGTYDMAVFDISGDGKLDLVLGQCGGTRIWIHDAVQGDLNGDGHVNVVDLVQLIQSWGDCPAEGSCVADVDGDGTVGVSDLTILILNWG